MKMKLKDFNNKHLGETVYIIGCAPTLNNLSEREINFLNNSTTIGVNFSHLKIKLKYWIGGHIEQAVFALESNLPYNVPLFAHCDERVRYVTQVWDSDRIIPVNASMPKLPLSRHADEKEDLAGATSIVLSAIHLAYIMGASKVVFVGFEGKNASHFYTTDEVLRKYTVRKIKQIMLSGKYWSNINYGHSVPFFNVHQAFEVMLGGHDLYGHFAEKESLEESDLTYFGKDDEVGNRNRDDIKNYVSFLNKNNIVTYTREKEGMLADTDSIIVDDLRTIE